MMGLYADIYREGEIIMGVLAWIIFIFILIGIIVSIARRKSTKSAHKNRSLSSHKSNGDRIRVSKSAWKSGNKQKALLAVKNENDQMKLTEIAQAAPIADVRIAAIKKLENQAVLIEIAKAYDNDGIRIAAIRKLTDKSVLADIAKHDKSLFVRREIISLSSDCAIFEHVAINDSDNDTRCMAVKKLAVCGAIGQTTLIKLVLSEPDSSVRKTAWHNLTLDSANEVAKTANVPLKHLCERIGEHGPTVQKHSDSFNEDRGAVDYFEWRSCQFCGDNVDSETNNMFFAIRPNPLV
jgi:hypothetical protein